MRKRMWAVLTVSPCGGLPCSRRHRRQSGGTLNMVAWEGYLEPGWVKPFEKQSGCNVNAEVCAARPTRW